MPEWDFEKLPPNSLKIEIKIHKGDAERMAA